MNKKESVYIVKFMSTGKHREDFVKVGKVYETYLINDKSGQQKKTIEMIRKQYESEIQKANPEIKIITKVMSVDAFKCDSLMIYDPKKQ
jgi:hypothetical protein